MDLKQLADQQQSKTKDFSDANLLKLSERQLKILQTWSTDIVQRIINIRFDDSKEDQERVREFVHWQGRLFQLNDLLKFDSNVLEQVSKNHQEEMQQHQQTIYDTNPNNGGGESMDFFENGMPSVN